MPRWDIQPGTVRGGLDRTHSAAVAFEEQMGAVNAALTGAAVQSSSQIVADAVTGLAQAQTSGVQFVFTRTNACIRGAAEATRAYIEGIWRWQRTRRRRPAMPRCRPHRVPVDQRGGNSPHRR